MGDSREVMNIRQASEYLGISADTLYKYASDGTIPAFKLGNRWRFKKSRLDQWMDEQSAQSAPAGARAQFQAHAELRTERKKPRSARLTAAGTR